MSHISVYRETDINPYQRDYYLQVDRKELEAAGFSVPDYLGKTFYLNSENARILRNTLQKLKQATTKIEIDPKTMFPINSEEYKDYYYPKK